jgi:lysophospholipase L1-like esterase
MKIYAVELIKTSGLHGRTVTDPDGSVLWFNWSCSGFTACFSGTTLKARLISLPNRMVMPMAQTEVIEYPCIGVRDEAITNEYISRIKLSEHDAWYTLFEGSDGKHSISVVKLSENARGKAGIMELETDGVFLPIPKNEHPLRIEVVGDSITCGYGNESSEPGFRTEEENGESAYGALAAKELGAEYSCVAVSGFSVSAPTWLPFQVDTQGMEDIYPYSDCLLERERGLSAFTLWDFTANHNDAVVINLGTNDVNEVKMLGFTAESIESFECHYKAFIKNIRALNGPDTFILCTLGSMDYYLYDNIKSVVEEYVKKTGDSRIACRKLGGIIPFTEGIGADTHPSAATHKRMGHELAVMLRGYLNLQ